MNRTGAVDPLLLLPQHKTIVYALPRGVPSASEEVPVDFKNVRHKNCIIIDLMIISILAFFIISTIACVVTSGLFITFKVRKFTNLKKSLKILIPIMAAAVAAVAEIVVVSFIISIVRCVKRDKRNKASGSKSSLSGNLRVNSPKISRVKETVETIADFRKKDDEKNISLREGSRVIFSQEYFFSSFRTWPRYSSDEEVLRKEHLLDLECILRKRYENSRYTYGEYIFFFHEMTQEGLIEEYRATLNGKSKIGYNSWSLTFLYESEIKSLIKYKNSNVIGDVELFQEEKNTILRKTVNSTFQFSDSDKPRDFEIYYKCNDTTTILQVKKFWESRCEDYVSLIQSIFLKDKQYQVNEAVKSRYKSFLECFLGLPSYYFHL